MSFTVSDDDSAIIKIFEKRFSTMKKLSNSIIKTYVLAFFAKYYGFSPKSGETEITYVSDDMSLIEVSVNGHNYGVSCETSYIEGIGFNGFTLDTLKITQITNDDE